MFNGLTRFACPGFVRVSRSDEKEDYRTTEQQCTNVRIRRPSLPAAYWRDGATLPLFRIVSTDPLPFPVRAVQLPELPTPGQFTHCLPPVLLTQICKLPSLLLLVEQSVPRERQIPSACPVVVAPAGPESEARAITRAVARVDNAIFPIFGASLFRLSKHAAL
jgi:hypothetical protein